MIPDAATVVLADLADWLVLALALGLIWHAVWRRRRGAAPVVDESTPAWRCDLWDLALAWLLVWMVRSVVTAPEAEGGAGGAAVPALDETAILSGLAMHVLLGGLLIFYLKGMRGRDPLEWLGLRERPLGRLIGRGVLMLGPAFLLVWAVAELTTPWLKQRGFEEAPQEIVSTFAEAPQWPMRLIIGLAATVVAPLVEEMTFRGFLYPVLKRYSDGVFAALVSSFIFGVAHQHLGGFLPLSALGLLLAWSYQRTGSLVVPVITHALFNTTTLAVLLLAERLPEG